MFALLALLLGAPTRAATLTVGAGGAYGAIQDAVDAASDGDILEIGAGTYTECVDLGGRDLIFLGAGSDSVLLDGEAACSAALVLEGGETATILGMSITNGSRRGVSLVDATALFQDVVIRDSGASDLDGGGVSIAGGDISFEDCVLSGNTGATGGNLSVVGSAELTLTRTELSAGTAEDGGGLYAGEDAGATPTLTLTDALIASNTASSRGAGLFLDEAVKLVSSGSTYESNLGARTQGAGIYATDDATLSSSGDTFSDNGSTSYTSASTYGGGIYLDGAASLTMDDALFTGNFARSGGAIAATDGSLLTITNSSFEENFTYIYGGALYADEGPQLSLAEVSFEGNRASNGSGGALFLGHEVTLDMADGVVSNNTSRTNGGGIYTEDYATVTITDTRFESNLTSTLKGGAIFAYYHVSLSLERVDFLSNSAKLGGGALFLDSFYGSCTLTDTTFQGNESATSSGGAIYAYQSVTLEIDGSTLSQNTASANGGAIYMNLGTLSVSGAVFEQNSASGGSGGGIALNNTTSYGPLTLSDTTFAQNSASTSGGGVYVVSTKAVDIDDVSFDGNQSAGPGGGLYASSVSELEVRGSRFTGNEASQGGGAYYAHTGSSYTSSWTNNLFVENQSSGQGGGLYQSQGTPSLTNNTLVGNGASTAGGGAYFENAKVNLVNNIFAYSSGGGGAYAADSTSASGTVSYNDWYDNTDGDGLGSFSFSSTGSGNLADDPRLVAYTADGDFDDDDLSLDADSTLIDAGDPTILDPYGSRSDIGAYGGPASTLWDVDGDHWYQHRDCDDEDATVYPGADELCDDQDNDCDDVVDEDVVDPISWCRDEDGDGYGDPETCVLACDPPSEDLVDGGEDCDDADPESRPGGVEILNDGIDQDCDGTDAIDEDGDGFASLATGGLDCDDADDSAYPGAEELCDGADDDCDGSTDEADATDASTWYVDADGDGWGDRARPTPGCVAPVGTVALDGDCDDDDDASYPGAAELPYDGVDQDCDGADWTDVDADGHDALPSGDDCDDEDASVYPGAEDLPEDGLDQDCDGEDAQLTDTGHEDSGDTSEDSADTGHEDSADTSEDSADTREDSADTGGDSADTGEQSDDTGEQSADTGEDGPGTGDVACAGCASKGASASVLPLLMGLAGLSRRRRDTLRAKAASDGPRP